MFVRNIFIRWVVLMAGVAFVVMTEFCWTAQVVNFRVDELDMITNVMTDADSSSTQLTQQEERESTLWNLSIPQDSKEIRKWGCNRTETPLVFVHIGKAGGGSVGTRIAASSLNYTKSKFGEVDDSYYPLPNNGKARFVASGFTRHLPSNEKTYEGTNPCHASTPLGQSIGCPETLGRYLRLEYKRHGECNPYSDTCHLVYMGHNFFGSEIHWLPVPYLKKWWSSLLGGKVHNAITPLWNKLLPDNIWCSSKNESRTVLAESFMHDYEECSIPLQREVDTKSILALTDQLSTDDTHVITSWSPLYASLPVLRVTVMRDPFTWLVSKYFWHRSKEGVENGYTCDDVEHAVERRLGNARPHKVGMNIAGPGWINRMSLGYIMYLCGEDCIVRYAAGSATLADLELQAEGNLRQAFAVVGILEQVDIFYEMLTARVQYLNTSLNPKVRGPKHSTGKSNETIYCKARFQDSQFQAKLLELSPELRALKRLYQVAKEVNQFQIQELQECSSGRLQ